MRDGNEPGLVPVREMMYLVLIVIHIVIVWKFKYLHKRFHTIAFVVSFMVLYNMYFCIHLFMVFFWIQHQLVIYALYNNIGC